MDTPVAELPGVGEAGAFGHPAGGAALTVAGAVSCSDRADTREKTIATTTSKRHRKLVLFFINYTPFSIYTLLRLKTEREVRIYFPG
jgi:hypothetical protein